MKYVQVKNEDTRTTSYFTPCSTVSISNFEHVTAGQLYGPLPIYRRRICDPIKHI